MKIVRLLLDSYSPYNDFQLFDVAKLFKGNFKNHTTLDSEEVGRTYLRSPYMWNRAYTGKELDGLTVRVNDDREGVYYSNIPSEDFLWNKVADQGVDTFIFPYPDGYFKLRDTTFSNHSPHLYGIIKPYHTSKYYKINQGEITSHKDYHPYYGLHEIEHASKDNREFFDKYWKLQEEDTKRTLYFVPDLLEDFEDIFYDAAKKYLESNIKHFKETTLPYLREKITGKEDYFIDFGLTESDTINHFAVVFPKVQELFQQYLEEIFVEFSYLNPDIMFIHGDHNMIPFNGKSYPGRRKLQSTVHFRGKDYGFENSRSWTLIPVFGAHFNRVGSDIFYNDEKVYEKFLEYYDPQKLLMDSIREFIIDNCKENV